MAKPMTIPSNLPGNKSYLSLPNSHFSDDFFSHNFPVIYRYVKFSHKNELY